MRAAVARGMDEAELVSMLDVTHDDDFPDAYVSLDRHLALWEHAMRTLREPGLPVLVGSTRSSADLQVRGFAAATSNTGWEACERGIRYSRLTTDTVRFELRSIEEGLVRLSMLRDGPRTLGHRCSNECALAAWVAQLRALLSKDFRCRRVTFQHASIVDRSEHVRHFGVEPEFDQALDAVVFESALLDLRPGARNPAMREFFDRHAETLLAQLGPETTGLRAQLRRTVAARLASGLPPMSDVAAEVGMSERALRRKLGAEGVRYQDLVVEVRMDLARRLLGTPEASLSEIAFVLGFSEHSAFSRFFRKHGGTSPREFRETQRGGAVVSGGLSPAS